MEPFPSAKEQIEAEALEWLLRSQLSQDRPDDREAFTEWLTRSPIHVQEYLAVSATWASLSTAEHTRWPTEQLLEQGRSCEPPNICRLQLPVRPHRGQDGSAAARSRTWLRWCGVAAAALIGLSVWLGYVQCYGRPVYRTAVGEQRSITLADGSIVVLNTHSELRVHLTTAERRIELIRGEAQFHVAKNPRRPFWVDTSDAAVRAVGTVFNVRDDPTGTQVAVLEGQVEMSAPSLMSSAGSALADVVGDGHSSTTVMPVSVSLQAGQRAAVTSHGIQRDSGSTVEAAAGWTQRRLVFRDEPLAMVVAEFNRYRDRPLVVDDPELASLRISGVFDAGDPESLVSYLESFEWVDADQLSDGSMHLLRQGERKAPLK